MLDLLQPDQDAEHRLPVRRMVLAPLWAARAARGCSLEQVQADIDCGRLQWVWNIAVNPTSRSRALRLWVRELIAPERCILLTPAQVIGMLLGSQRQHWGAAELSQLLACTRMHVHDLWSAGALPLVKHEGRAVTTRAGLERFFQERLIGGRA